MRVVSLVPSLTELICDLGIIPVGKTIFCVHPKGLNIPKIGGTKKLNIPKIQALKPDLIIANREENEKADIEALQKEFKVLLTEIYTYEDALEAILQIGKLLNKEVKASELVHSIDAAFSGLANRSLGPKVLYLIWRDPYMAAGHKTFIHSMMLRAGFENVITDSESRYPVLDQGDIENLKPDYLFLSTEPYPFRQAHVTTIQNAFPFSKVILVNGEMFSWYGSRMLLAANYFSELENSLRTTN